MSSLALKRRSRKGKKLRNRREGMEEGMEGRK